MLYAHHSCDLSVVGQTIADGTRPASSFGTSVTPVQNALSGAWATVISATTEEIHKLDICLNNWFISGAARGTLVEIGYDLAGGTTGTSLVVLACGGAETYGNALGLGAFFELPINLPAGCSILARASVNSATLTAGYVFATAYGQPSPSHLWRPARRIEQLGVTLASSAGTAVTSGTSSEGAWTSIGTLAQRAFAFEFGISFHEATCNSTLYDIDLAVGDASNKRVILRNHPVRTSSTNDAYVKASAITYANAAAGDIVYARSQCGPNAASTNMSIAVYAMGD